MDFRNLILNIPSQIELGIDAARGIKIKKYKQIIICGMGGSALAGEFLKTVFNEYKINIPLILHKDYELPYNALPGSLIVCASFSGNTEETISAFQKALKLKNSKIIVLANGGILGKLALKNKTDFIKINLDSIPPRLTTLFMFSALISILTNAEIIPVKAQNLFKSSFKNISVFKIENIATNLADKIADKTPLIYSSLHLQPLTYFLKISFNENAKTHAFANILPESQHNEIQGFSDALLNERFYVIFLKDSKNEKIISKRIDIMAEMIFKRGFDYFVIDIAGKNIFEKIIFSLFLGNFLSLKSAQIKNQDPYATLLIDELKDAMKN